MILCSRGPYKYLYLIWNPLKIKIFLLLLQAARLDQVPYLYYVIILLIKICVIRLSNRALYRVQNRQTFASLLISLYIWWLS